MKTPRSKSEIEYIRLKLKPILARLDDADEQLSFLLFARQRGVNDPIDFANRVRLSLKGGRIPSTFTAILFLEFEAVRREADRGVKKKKPRARA